MATVAQTAVLTNSMEDKIKRFDVHQVIQHAGLAITFILLVLTGLPIKFSSLGISQWWALVWGGIDNLRAVHHFAAWAIVFFCFYHLFYLIYKHAILKKPFPMSIVPSLQDARRLFQEISYYLGITKEKPKYGRFNWKEKFDYWAIFWGMPVMGISGFILMFPVLVTKFLPGWVVPTALVAHSDEAMLALTWIFAVHIFFNHFSPGVFPANTTMFTGKISKERQELDHPLEFEQVPEPEKEEEIG
jgi:cytochrome b subunit of formate dehydrogenase